MDNLHNFGNSLNTFADKNQPNEAEGLISQINKTFTESELTPFIIDTYLLNIFNKTNGLLNFLTRILYKAEYKKTKLKCFELLYTLVNNCTDKVQNYLVDIIKTCSPVVRSAASVIEKQKSLELITLIICKGNLHANGQNDVDTELSNLYNNTLFECLHYRFDKSNTVQEELLVAIGAVTKKFPTAITNPLELRNALINQLNRELHKTNKSFPVIKGAVTALSSFLENFPFNPDEDKTTADTIYKCCKILADPGDASRRAAFRESLSLVAKHTVLLSNALYFDAKWWHTTLLKWFDLGVEDKKAAYGVLDAFYREMANILSARNEDSDRELFKYFMDYFIEIITKPSAENYQMQLTIRGFGLLARSFRTHITPQEVNKIFITISQIMEHTYILNHELNPDQIMYLPHYVQTLSFITKNLPQLNNTHIACLQRVSVLMIKIFPQVSPAQYHLVIDAFVLTSFQLLQCQGNVLENFFEDVVYQGVLWTCSHQIALDAELYKDQDQQITTYKNYLPLWNGLLRIINSMKYEKYEISMKMKKLIVRKLLDELIKTLFLLINKLNLNTKLKDSNLPITDPESAYEAVQTNDFVIFVNVVDFYQEVLENVDQGMFKMWIGKFVNQVILKSTKHPLVSGFYKLLAACLKVCDNLNYFEDSRLSTKEDLNVCYQSVCKFLQEILWKMKQYKGDLQVACMHAILAAPICTVKDLLPWAASAFITLFSVGRSYLKLADLGIDTMERWLKHIPQNDIKPFLKEVLPSLDSYLQSRSLGGNCISNQTLKSRKTKLAVNKRKVLVEMEPELLKLQIKILTFIGQLNNDLCLTFVSSGDSIEPVVWNKTPYLKITLPYADTKLNLYLDKFVPRIIELALYSSDRKIRVVACELLHAVVMIILGTSHSLDLSKLKDLDCLMKAVAAPVLKLGCDMDQVIQQLYSSLALQLMHYYSHPRQMCSSHTQIVIEALIEAISNPTDSALRDFAGICIKEFVTWTIKQADHDDLLKNPINIKLWIRTMCSFSMHPDPFKRLGAALMFNHIYTILREEPHMFSMFWLEILHAFVINLSLIQVNNMDDNNCIDQVSQALNHVERGFVEKYVIFNKNDSVRRKPPGFEGSLLKDVAIWLLKETGSINPYCRQKCMSIFCKIAPLVTNCNNNLQTFKQLYIVNDLEWISLTYEAELLKNPTLNNLHNSEDISGLFKWMQGLLCAIDGYIFVITNNLMPTTFISKRSTFFVSLQFFLEFVQLQSFSEVLNLILDSGITKIYTTIDKETFNSFKSSIVTKTIKFAMTVLENNADLTYITSTPQLLWGNNLWSLICHRIFYASALGFDITNVDSYDELLSLLNQISNCCPSDIVNSLTNSLSTYIISTLASNTDTELNIISLKQKHLLKGMLLLQQSYLAQKLNIGKYVTGTIRNLLCGLAESKDGGKVLVKLHRSAQHFWELKLDLALKDKQEFYDMVRFMLNQTKVKNQEQNEEIEYGTYFFETFKNVIIKYLFQNYPTFLEEIFKVGTVDKALKYTLEVLRYIHHNPKTIEHETLQNIVQMSLDNWEKMLPNFDANTTQKLLGIEFITKLAYITIEPLHNLTKSKPELIRWMVSLIHFEDLQWTSEASLDFKSNIFKVLSYIIGPFDEFESELRDALQYLKENYFTSKPNNVNIALITTFKKILEAAKVSKSKILLSCAVDIYVTTPYSTEVVDLKFTLKPFIRYTTVERQIATLHCIHKMCFNTTKFTTAQRYFLAKDVLPTLLQNCYYSAFEQFYIAVIASILSFLDKKNNPTSFNTVYTVNKTIAYILIELLFSRIKTENFDNNSCLITKAALPDKTDTKLTKLLTQSASQVCKEKYNLCTQEEKDMFRLYQCHSYNTLVSIISNTKTEIKYYNWLFSREENKQDILWKNLVDTDKNYLFSIDFDAVPSIKKILVNIRSNLLAARKNVDADAHTVKYIESQHLFKSTLSEDITRFDFTHATLRNQVEKNETSNIETRREIQVVLESIDINKHECMATLCGLIQHMVENDISPLPIENEEVLLPKWMKEIRNVLMTDTTHNNVKIFLVKVIHNTHHIFKPYAKWILAPIIKVIVDGCIGNSTNFFITDLVIMLTSWSDVAIPVEDQELASELLKFLMRNADSDHKAIFKYNLEQIKLVLEVWKSCLVIPYDLLYQKLQLEFTSPKLDVGIHLVAAVLANNVTPWHPNEAKNFLMHLTKISIKSTHRSVYQPCAEVLGMSLKYMSMDPDSSQHLDKFQDYLHHKLLLKLVPDDDKFAYCLQGLVLHYPVIADKYLCRMVSKLSHIHGNFKCIYLKIFLARLEILQSINELSSIDFQKLLTDDNFEVQVLTLEIIKKSGQYLRYTELIPVLKDVSKFVNNSFSICRTIMYDIIINSYNIHSKQSEPSKEVIGVCRDVLLQGLVDKESALQEKIVMFWSNADNLPVDISKRFLYLLNNMYKPDIEEHYVGYSTFLLLNTIKSSEEFNEKIFQHALYECDFQDYKLISNWRRQHASIAPLFADTLRSQDNTLSPMNPNVLRATLSTLEFQPTQAGASNSTPRSSYFANSSSLLFSINASNDGEMQGGVFKDPNHVLPAMKGIRSRRFLKDKSKISRHCAYLEVSKSLQAEELRKDRVKQRDRNITVYRKYRIGDYPDIEMTLSSVITPLQMLARCDAALARCLYTSLFTSLLSKIKNGEKQDDNFVQSVNLSIDNILNRSTQFIPSVIGTFLDIALAYKNALRFDPNIITNVCRLSGLLSVGSLLLEEYLISEEIHYTTPAKRSKGVENENIVCWIKFAELYKEMDEWDVVSAIFLEKMNCSEMVLSAIEAESCGHWRSAQEFYARVIEEDASEERRDFYYESYFKCFAALAEWDELSDIIEQTAVINNKDNIWASLWDDDWNQQKLLPWYITAGLRNILHGTDRKLFISVNNSLNDVEKLAYLKLNFGEELAMLWLLQNDSNTATYYLNNSINNFLENWSHLNPLFIKLRINRVLNLQTLMDIYLFLNAINSINPENQKYVEALLKSWQETSQGTMESLILSETRTVYQNQFISTLRTKLQSTLSADDLKTRDKSLNECKFKLHLNLIENALGQGNYYVARKYIKLSPKPNTDNQMEMMQWSLALSKINFLRAQTIDNSAEKLPVMMDSLSRIDTMCNSTVTQDGNMCYLIKTKEHVYHLTQEIYKIISVNESLFNKNQQKLQKLVGKFPLENVEAIWRFGVTSLQNSLNFCENEVNLMMNNDNLKVYTHMADAYVKLAYCAQNKGEEFVDDFILCVLRSMKHGSVEGKQLFPCLLSQDIGITFKDTFVKESSQIPTWMFLGWLPQLLANLDTSCIFVISDILLQIAKTYPQAIMYAYRLSKEKYKFNSDDIGILGKEITEKLDDLLLCDNLIDKFLTAVACVAPPTNILRYHLRKLMNVCKSKKNFSIVLQKIFDEVYFETSDYKNVNSIQGSMFKEIKKYETKIKNISKGKFEAVENALKTLHTELDNLKYKKSTKLMDYSPWLANIQATDLHASLEIPGQYTGEKRPLMQYHIKIMGFSQNVQSFASMRAPIRITILGNDAKEYHYLIKFGEDLRQDQRVEQIFNVMNNIFLHDANCLKRQLSLNTYQVIPLNSRLGIIEWVNNTTELKQFIENSICDQHEKKNYEISGNDYTSWILKAVPRNQKASSPGISYGFACIKYNRDNVICKYRALVNSLSLDVLRKSFWSISVNSESFFALRQKFATSYAVMCISHWLLGIGDRHLLNCLISLRSGQAIGIDFGHAFGTATQILPVPELVPFRLTPHILHLLQPLGERGLLQETMIHCLRAFRKNSNMLLATMTVFIKEPSLDWLDFARRSELNSHQLLDQDWYPNQKIMHAQQKLQGANPTSIMIEELKAGHSHTQFLDAYINLVKGTTEYDFRARKGDDLSEEDQVKCLLDQSTDYNLLGRMWVGWQPWV